MYAVPSAPMWRWSGARPARWTWRWSRPLCASLIPSGARSSSTARLSGFVGMPGGRQTRRRPPNGRKSQVTDHAETDPADADRLDVVDRHPIEIDVLTLFPGMFSGPLAESIPGRVQTRGLATIRVHDLRQWGLGRHKTVDDYTYGGGAGMVLRPEPVAAALDVLRRPESTVILPDPGGEVFGQARAHDLAGRPHLIILCPRYEGVDERIRSMIDLELSIGDYVLSGGEIPALVVIDSVLRLLPGAIDAESTAE